MEYGIDGTWYDIRSSHHYRHALGGAALGAAGYTGAAVVGASRPARYATAIGGAALAATLWEYGQARHGSIIDPADIGWTVASAAVGACLADLTAGWVTVVAKPRGAALEVAWRF